MKADATGVYSGSRLATVTLPGGSIIYNQPATWQFTEGTIGAVAEADGPQINNGGAGIPAQTSLLNQFTYSSYHS